MHVVAHVGDRHHEAKALPGPLAVDRVVEILGRLAVDRHQRQRPEILAALQIRTPHRARQSRGELFRRRRELERQLVLAQRDLDLHARVAEVAEDLDHPADRLDVQPGLDDELRGDDLARLRAAGRAGLDHDVVLDPAVRGGHERDATLGVEPSDDAPVRPLDDLDDPALAAATAVDARRTHEHGVAVHHLAHLPGREIQIRPTVVGHHESVSVRMRLDPAAHHVDLACDEDCGLAIAEDLAVALHRPETAREGVRLLAAHAEELGEPPLVDRNRLLLERLQDELAAWQRLGVALGLARALRIGRAPRCR